MTNLKSTGGRNEPKSFDFADRQGQPSILPHHQVSAAWSEKNEGRRPRLELKSGDLSSFSSGAVHSTSGPQFANELTYTRTTSSRRTSNLAGTGYTQAGSSGVENSNIVSGGHSGGNSNAFIATGNPTNGATFHRNSRVPATGDYFYPKSSSVTQTRAIQYPPLRKLSVGDGEGEVI